MVLCVVILLNQVLLVRVFFLSLVCLFDLGNGSYCCSSFLFLIYPINSNLKGVFAFQLVYFFGGGSVHIYICIKREL